MPFNVSKIKEWVLHYRNIRNEVESQLGEKLKTKSINGEARYMHGKLKERIKTNVNGQGVLYDIYCNTTEFLNVTSVKVKTTILRYMLKNANTLMHKASNVTS